MCQDHQKKLDIPSLDQPVDPSIPLFDKQPSDNPAHPESKHTYDCLALSVSDTKEDAIPEYRGVQLDITPQIDVKVCPRLRDPTCGRRANSMQPTAGQTFLAIPVLPYDV